MNRLLWVLQTLMALHSVTGAVWKLSNPAQMIPSLKIIPHPIWMGMSIIEIICGLGFVLPAFAFFLPTFRKPMSFLVPMAAVLIAAEMLLFCGLHLYSGVTDSGSVIYWSVVATLCAFIAYGRIHLSNP